MEAILKISHLTKIFQGRKQKAQTAVEDVSFEVLNGEKTAIIGESGSGKTTLVQLIMRLLEGNEGEIWFDGTDITHCTKKEMRTHYRKMQMVFQNPAESFDPRQTLGDSALEGLRNAGWNKKEAKEKMTELFARCSLAPELLERYPHEVSGGQCQRAAIARALATEPKLLILDEATSALDTVTQKEILELLAELQEEKKMTYLFISHDISLVKNFCDRVLVMYQGKIVEQGSTQKVLQDPKHSYTKLLLNSVL